MTMISLYLKKATQAQIPLTNPAGIIFPKLQRRKAGSLGRYSTLRNENKFDLLNLLHIDLFYV